MDALAEELIPIVLFLSIAAGYAINRYLRYRAHKETQMTLRVAIEQGNDITAETLAATLPRSSPSDDRRRAAISLGLAIAIATFALMLGEEDALGPLLGIASFPLFLSFAYFWLSREKQATGPESS